MQESTRKYKISLCFHQICFLVVERESRKDHPLSNNQEPCTEIVGSFLIKLLHTLKLKIKYLTLPENNNAVRE